MDNIKNYIWKKGNFFKFALEFVWPTEGVKMYCRLDTEWIGYRRNI